MPSIYRPLIFHLRSSSVGQLYDYVLHPILHIGYMNTMEAAWNAFGSDSDSSDSEDDNGVAGREVATRLMQQ